MKLLITFEYPRGGVYKVIRSGSFDDIRERYDNPLFIGTKENCHKFIDAHERESR